MIKIKDHYLLKLILVLLIACLYVLIVPIIKGGAFNAFSDDLLQYQLMMEGLFERIKNNSLSLYSLDISFGCSIFSLTYYIPLDIFTLATFVLSYIVDFDIAYSFVNISKIFFGVIVFYKLFKFLGFNEKTSFVVSLIYLINGSLTVFCNFGAYVSLYFYLPLTVFIFKKYYKSNTKFPIALLIFVLLLWNFYLAYTLILGTLLFLIAFDYFYSQRQIKQFLKEELLYFIKIIPMAILGVLLSSFLVFPSIVYIINYTSVKRPMELLFTYKHFISLWINSIVPQALGRHVELSSNLGYIESQSSLYIGIFGFLSIISLFLKKDYNRKKIGFILISELILISLPIFSMIFSASYSPYSRWFFSITLINLFLIALNFEKDEFKLSIYKNHFAMLLTGIFYICSAIIIVIFNKNNLRETFCLIGIGVELFSLFSLLISHVLNKFSKKIKFDVLLLSIVNIIIFTTVFDVFTINSTLYTNIDSNIDEISSLLPEDNSFNRKYMLLDKYPTNLNMATDMLINEKAVFHSFISKNDFVYLSNYTANKYAVDFYNDWSFKNNYLSTEQAMNFLNSKYLIFDKNTDKQYQNLENLVFISENENYKIYENSNARMGTVYYESHSKPYDTVLENQFSLDNSVLDDSGFLPQSIANNYNVESFVLECIKTDHFSAINDLCYSYDISNFDIEKKYFILGNYYEELYIEQNDGTIIHLQEPCFEFKKEYQTIYSSKQIYAFESINKNDIPSSIKHEENINVQISKNKYKVEVKNLQKEKSILVLPITYSDEFSISNGLEIVKANGGFIGIKLNSSDDINFTISYKPKGLNTGIALTATSVLIIFSFKTHELLIKKRKKLTNQR